MNTYTPLFEFIAKIVPLPESDAQLLGDKMSVKSFEKGDLIVREGQTCRTLHFVLSGVYRNYKVEDGESITSYFSYDFRNPFVASFVSLLSEQASKENVECIIPGEMISIAYKDWKAVYSISHALNTFGRIMAEFNYVLAIERIESLQYKQATDRYQQFLKLYPGLLNMIPHHYIASYLGVTPESMSRIRKNTLSS